jgi:hypothetical protein
MAVRLALIQLPQLLADVIGSVFTADDDVVVVQLSDELGDLRDSDGQRRHDVVIAGVDDPWDDGLRAQIARIDAVVLGVRPDGRLTWIYEMQPCPRVLGALDPAQLRRAVLDSSTLGMR